jgi:hypothetical protein
VGGDRVVGTTDENGQKALVRWLIGQRKYTGARFSARPPRSRDGPGGIEGRGSLDEGGRLKHRNEAERSEAE